MVNSSHNLDALLEHIRSSTDWQTREDAIHELIVLDTKDERVLPLMGQLLRDLDEQAEDLFEEEDRDLDSLEAAIEAIILGFGEAALPHLREWGRDRSPIMRSEAVSLLANMAMSLRTAAPISELIAMLEVESDPHVQHMLTTTLEMIGTPEALDAIANWKGN